MSAADGAGVAVSVVIPVYNTRPYLAECLDSVLDQDLAPARLEVVAVDDGSTDGSSALLDEYAARHPNLRVLHQANSGWPGAPRNAGRAASVGDYVFFADSDDRLAPEALRRLLDFAVQHDSDVVVPKVVPLEGPARPSPVWRRTRVDAELSQLIYTLGPWKLFRRRFLEEQDLWFPEGRVRLEDGIFVTQAYVTARRVSVLADQDYYAKRTQPDSGNISSAAAEPEDYISSLGQIMATIRRHCPDEQVADAAIATLYRRKALKWFRPDRFPGFAPARRSAWVQAVRGLQEAYVPPRIDDRLPLLQRTRSVLVRHGEVEALAGLGAAQQAGRPLRTVLTDSWLELAVPGLTTSPALVVAPGLRLVPAGRSGPRPPRTAALAAAVGRRIGPAARGTVLGRRVWTWARDRQGSRR